MVPGSLLACLRLLVQLRVCVSQLIEPAAHRAGVTRLCREVCLHFLQLRLPVPQLAGLRPWRCWQRGPPT